MDSRKGVERYPKTPSKTCQQYYLLERLVVLPQKTCVQNFMGCILPCIITQVETGSLQYQFPLFRVIFH